MAFGIDFPQINGFFPSWAEIQCAMAGFDTDAIQSINFDDKVDIGDVYGAGPLKQGTTRGQAKPGVIKVAVLSDFSDTFEESLALNASDGQSISLVQFPFQIQWLKADGGYAQRNFEGCRVQSVSEAKKIGNDAFVVEYELNVTRVTRESNGIERGLLLSAG